MTYNIDMIVSCPIHLFFFLKKKNSPREHVLCILYQCNSQMSKLMNERVICPNPENKFRTFYYHFTEWKRQNCRQLGALS